MERFNSHDLARACNELQYIPNVAGTLYTEQMNTDTVLALLKASEKMKTLTEMYNNVLDDLKTAKQTTLKAIQKFRQELNHMLDKLEQSTKQQLDDQYQTLQTQWQTIIEKGTVIAHNFQKQLDQLQNVESNTSQQFIVAKMSKENISLTDTMTRQLLPFSIEIVFSQSQVIKSCVEQMSSLGNISHSIVSGKLGLYKAKDSHKHNVRIMSDTDTCNISGSCVLDSGHLLLTDYSNKKLKLFDTNMNAVTGDCTMPDSPNAVCLVSDIEAAVSLNKKMIQFVSISNGLLPTRILKMDHYCIGLAIAVDKMYITYGRNLYVHKLSGELLKTINKDQSGEKIFSRACDLTNTNNSSIHVADMENGLITLDTQGQVLLKYNRSDLKGACGVVTDFFGNIFVCGFHSHNVLQLGHDGQRLGELISNIHGVSNPRSVLFDKKNCRLILTCFSDDYILAFTLE